ncbi:hypothetical protein NMY22_g4227 [Coprinellus aureogranulatus]|nr:hypothetical protein NMY22_g4227 [Coprinellus aureogranulatus]
MDSPSESPRELAFPQELVDSIVDLSRGERPLLKTLGLVSSAWYPRTRIHLFRKITLGGHLNPLTNQESCERLHHVLDQRPSLYKLIDRIKLMDGESDSDYWIGECPVVAKILPLLTSVTRVKFWFIDFERYTGSLQIELYDLMARPSVFKLALTTIRNLDPSPLAQYHHVRELSLKDVRPCAAASRTKGACFPLNNRNLLEFPSSVNEAQDRSFHLNVADCGEVLTTLLVCAGSPQGTLRVLWPSILSVTTARFDQEMASGCGALASHGESAGSVRLYSICQDERKQDLLEGQTLPPFPTTAFSMISRFPRLQGLMVMSTYQHFLREGYSFFPYLIAQLFDISSRHSASGQSSSMSYIALAVHVNVVDDQLRSAIMLLICQCHAGWRLLDHVLMDSSFAKVELLQVTFSASRKAFPDGELDQYWISLRAILLGHLRNLHKKGAVNVKLDATLNSWVSVVEHFLHS